MGAADHDDRLVELDDRLAELVVGLADAPIERPTGTPVSPSTRAPAGSTGSPGGDRAGWAATPRPAVVRVAVPAADSVVQAAAGVADPATGRMLTVDDPVHVASVGKLITAAVVLRVAEAGALGPAGVDVSLVETGALPRPVVEHLVVLDGVALGAAITLRHLLTHTAGLRDAMTDDADHLAGELGRPAPGSIVGGLLRAAVAAAHGDEVGAAPGRQRWVGWDPDRPDDPDAGTINRYVGGGLGAEPVGAPGERFHYSDTGFALLATVAEHVAGRPFHELVRALVLDPLGLAGSWTAGHEPPPTGRSAAEVWLGPFPLQTLGLSLSFDWGGGGQVMPVADLQALLAGLLAGRPFRDPATGVALAAFAAPAGIAPPRTGIGLALQRWALPDGRVVLGHAGAWGARVFVDPRTGVAVAGTADPADGGRWLSDVFTLVDTCTRGCP